MVPNWWTKADIKIAKNVENAFWTIAQQALIYDQQDTSKSLSKSGQKVILSDPDAVSSAKWKCYC